MPAFRQTIAQTRRLVRAGGALVVVGLFAAGFGLWQLREDAFTQAQEDTRRLAVVIAEQTTRTLQAVDLFLQESAHEIAMHGVTDAESFRREFEGRPVHEAMARRLPDLPQIEAVGLFDAEGRAVNGTRVWPFKTVTIPDRGYFAHWIDNTDSSLFISEPVLNKVTGLMTLIVSRRLTSLDGHFLGVINASMRLSYFEDFFAGIGFEPGVGITILRTEGTILSHYPPHRIPIGTRLASLGDWERAILAGGGHYRSLGTTDGLGPRVVSAHPLTAYPLVVNVSRLEDAALAHWRRQAWELGLAALCSTVLFALLLRALSRQIALIVRVRTDIRLKSDALEERDARLADQSAVLQATLDHMDQGLMMVDTSGRVVVHNRAFLALLDLPRELLESQPQFEALMDFMDRRGDFVVRMEDGSTDIVPRPRIADYESVYERLRPNGTLLEIRSVPLKQGGMVRTYTDITARAAAERMISHNATHDPLTGLLNRAGFTGALEAAMAAAVRGNGVLAVLCLDLDRFKQVNDTLGHAAGDALLRFAADRMRAELRDGDVLARMGGDEFAIVLAGSKAAAACETVAQRLLASIRNPYRIGEEVVRIGVSIGIAAYPEDGGTIELLLANADAALYQAKGAGRNTWRVYASAEGARERQQAKLAQDLRMAVELQQLTLAFQPICDTATAAPVAFEALLRWTHPERGPVPPAVFIPIAEETGLIVQIGKWVFETACAHAATWALPVRVAINLSPAQFHQRDLLAFIRDVLERTGLAPARLELEVTEGLLLENVGQVSETMNALRRMGVRLVLDDFGTAHSSLSTLHDFPFDQIKIDRSFIAALTRDRQARTLVEAMLAMARALGLDVVAEGIETQEQLTLLRMLRCERVQGYLLGHPESADTVRDRVWSLASQRDGVPMLAAG